MKKTLLLFAAIGMALSASAVEYTDNLSVSVNGEGTTQTATVTVEYVDDNTINFTLPNFILTSSEDDNEIYVGNIALENLTLVQADDCSYKTFSFNDEIQIAEGDLEGAEGWIGPLLGDVPLVLNGKLTDEALYVTIDIDMQSSLGQTIKVVFGSDIANGISSAKAATEASATYNLAGQKVQTPGKGIYVVGGKKVLY